MGEEGCAASTAFKLERAQQAASFQGQSFAVVEVGHWFKPGTPPDSSRQLQEGLGGHALAQGKGIRDTATEGLSRGLAALGDVSESRCSPVSGGWGPTISYTTQGGAGPSLPRKAIQHLRPPKKSLTLHKARPQLQWQRQGLGCGPEGENAELHALLEKQAVG